jgi:diguanylate cyclase (GGDEF)-like protein/PAS domain S-box-containing protein
MVSRWGCDGGGGLLGASRRWWWQLLVLAVACYGGAHVGLALGLFDSQVSPFWPPTGIATAGFLVWGRSRWPAVAAATLAVHAPLDHDLRATALITAGSVLAPLLAATLLRRAQFRPELDRLRDALALVGLGSLAMTVSATFGTAAVLLAGASSSEAPSVWATWFTGDAVGAVVVTPFLLCLQAHCRAPRLRAWRAAEWLGTMALTAGATAVGFRSDHGLRFVVFPVLAVAAIRFQVRGAAPATLLAALVAAQTASQSMGIFRDVDEAHAMLALGLFNGCAAFTSYLSAALTADRARGLQALVVQSEQLERLVAGRTEELSGALAQLAQAQQIARMGSYQFDLVTGQARWSDQLYRLVDLPLDSPMSLQRYLELCHPDEREAVQAALAGALEHAEPFTLDHRLRRTDGSYRWLQLQGQAEHTSDGEVVGVRGTETDIDARKAAERRFQQLVEMAPDAMVFVDGEGVITQVNLQAESLFGYRRADLVGRPLEVLIPDRYHGAHRRHRQRFSAHPDMRPMGRDLELLARRSDGTEFPVEISLAPLETDEGTLVSAAIRDVTLRTQQRDELAYRGLHDALTGLPNRVLLADRLARAVAALERAPGTVAALAFLDLDRFKWVNDSLGHDAGDALLRAVAGRLALAVRPEDSVARFGGDEFVVLAEGLRGDDEAWALVDRLRSTVSEPVSLPDGQVVVPTVSIGLTTTDDPHADPAALLRDADAAMYRAKEQGRDRTAVFAPEIHSELSTRLATAGGLRTAVEQSQLSVHYQPIVSLLTGAPLAVEALVRWEHPERGTLLPGHFIGLAEETGQIGALDRSVILTACREFGELVTTTPAAHALTLNLNVSLRHLSTSALRQTLVEGLAAGGLQPHQVTVEVTESANLSGDDFTALLRMVRDLGARIAIDDFGTGFSALSRLAGLAVDTIKVDRSFVTDVHTSQRGQAIVAAMTQLSTALGATVIAEGVEHVEQAQALQRLGCTGAQGFLWSRGLPVEELSCWLPGPRIPEPRRDRQPVHGS